MTAYPSSDNLQLAKAFADFHHTPNVQAKGSKGRVAGFGGTISVAVVALHSCHSLSWKRGSPPAFSTAPCLCVIYCLENRSEVRHVRVLADDSLAPPTQGTVCAGNVEKPRRLLRR